MDNCVQLTCITSHAWTVYCSEVWHAYPKLKHAFQAQLPPTGTSFSTASCLLGNDRRGNKLHFLEKICSRRQCPEWITYQRGWNAVIFTGREIEKEGGVGVGGGSKHFCALTLPLFRSSRLSFFLSEHEKTQKHPCWASEGPAWHEINKNLDGGARLVEEYMELLYSHFWTARKLQHCSTFKFELSCSCFEGALRYHHETALNAGMFTC